MLQEQSDHCRADVLTGVSPQTFDVFANGLISQAEEARSLIDSVTRGTAGLLVEATRRCQIKFVSDLGDAGFEWPPSEGKIRFSFQSAASICQGAVNSLDLALEKSTAKKRALVRSAIGPGVRMFVAHELFHPHQGLATLADVRSAVPLMGSSLLAKFDADADVRAAVLEASLASFRAGKLDPENILREFEDALLYQLRFCAPVFRCPPSKPHKRGRVGGLALQAARVAVANRSMRRRPLKASEFDDLLTPIFLHFNEKTGEIGVLSLDPHKWLGRASVDVSGLNRFLDLLDSGQIDKIVKESIVIGMAIGLIAT